MVLYLLQVLGCSVLMDLRNRATHFALFTTVSELSIRYFATNKQLVLPWQAAQTKCIFRHPPTISNCMQNLRGGQNFSFPTLLDSYRKLLLSLSNAHNLIKRVKCPQPEADSWFIYLIGTNFAILARRYISRGFIFAILTGEYEKKALNFAI